MAAKPIALALIALMAPFASLAMAAPPLVPAAPRCEATVTAKLSRVEPKQLVTTHTYTVDVTTLEPCAKISFALATSERISKTKVEAGTASDEVTLRNGSISRILSYDMPNGREMERWEVKLTGCERCEP